MKLLVRVLPVMLDLEQEIMASDFDRQQRILRGSGKTTLNLPAVRGDPKPDQVLLNAVREIAEGAYDVLGEMGRGKRGSVVYLARDLQTTRLVALKLEHEGQDEYGLEVIRALDKSLPAAEGSCPRCGSRLAGWGRFCPQCGADVSGAAQDKTAAELMEAVKDAAGDDLEVLGEMGRAEGGGRVYFARDNSDGRIIALRLQKDPDAQGSDEYVIDRTQVLKPIAAGVDATVVRPAVRPPPPLHTGPPPVLRPAPKPQGRSGLMRTADFARSVAADRRVLIGAAALAVFGVVAIVVALGGNGDAEEVAAPPSPEPIVQTPPPARPTVVPIDSPQVEIRAGDLPQNARITVDGRDFAPGARFKLAPGSHVFRIAASGYREVVDTVDLGQGQSLIYSTPTLQRVQAARRNVPPQQSQPRPVREQEPDPVAEQPRVTCQDAYQNGDYPQARVLCEQAMAVGDPVAITTLGIMHELGRGVPTDLARAAELYRRAANAGNARAQLNLGIMYQDGRGVARDDVRAAALFREAAEQESPDAQAQLGHAYQLGRGVDQNLRMAQSWYARGAEQDHSWSQFLLGYLLLQGGGGVPQDEGEAFRLLLSAAEKNLVAAQLEVAQSYRDGRGVPQSTASAIEWYERAGTAEALAEANRLRNPQDSRNP